MSDSLDTNAGLTAFLFANNATDPGGPDNGDGDKDPDRWSTMQILIFILFVVICIIGVLYAQS